MNSKEMHKILNNFFSSTIISGTIEGEFVFAFESEVYDLVLIIMRGEPEMNRVKVMIRSTKGKEEDAK